MLITLELKKHALLIQEQRNGPSYCTCSRPPASRALYNKGDQSGPPASAIEETFLMETGITVLQLIFNHLLCIDGG